MNNEATNYEQLVQKCFFVAELAKKWNLRYIGV